MFRVLQQRLRRLSNTSLRGVLKGGKIGLEKESLRVTRDGKLAQTPHPRAFGSALTHPYITTDYSEALIELITPPLTDAHDSAEFLCDAHQFVYANLDEELIWATSMPCIVGGETSIPIATYGSSNVGKMKHVYRVGLGYRYGRVMQAIAGVHFNYSLPEEFWPIYQETEENSQPLQDFIADSYFCLIRNLQRFGWLVPYLFGASPALCKSFFEAEAADFEEFDYGTLYKPYATSLRMSDIGYSNKSPPGLGIVYDNLGSYVESLTRAIETPYPPYEEIGVVVDGEYRQLNANYLQVENEYYTTVRAKQVPRPLEKPTLAMKERGVQYVELRSLDVDAFEPIGVNHNQLRFLEALLVFCLLHESPVIAEDERSEINHNQMMAACCGRDPSLSLQRRGQPTALKSWASETLDAMRGICEFLDEGRDEQPYAESLAVQMEAVKDTDRMPSSRILHAMRESGETFFHFAMRMSNEHRRYFAELKANPKTTKYFEDLSRQSLERQEEVETADEVSFSEFLQWYFAQT